MGADIHMCLIKQSTGFVVIENLLTKVVLTYTHTNKLLLYHMMKILKIVLYICGLTIKHKEALMPPLFFLKIMI